MPHESYPSDCDVTRGLLAMGNRHQSALHRGRSIRLLALDVDGILTDGTLYYGPGGQEWKAFHVRDGLGIRLLLEAGLEVALITARQSEVVARRAADLGLTHVFQSARRKKETCQTLADRLGLAWSQIAFMGDDWLDLALLRQVGLAATVPEAPREVKEAAHFITTTGGGRGAVREVCHLLLEAQGLVAGILDALPR
ncbi:MAG: HAD hydrolase family protein [Thermodesulfobacteriota bacterium]